MATLLEEIQRENQTPDGIDIGGTGAILETNKAVQSEGSRAFGDIPMMVDAITNDGSTGDALIAEQNQAKLGFDPASGDPMMGNLVPALVTGGVAFKAAELATVGIIGAARATAIKASEKAFMRSKTTQNSVDAASSRIGRLYEGKANNIRNARDAKKAEYLKANRNNPNYNGELDKGLKSIDDEFAEQIAKAESAGEKAKLTAAANKRKSALRSFYKQKAGQVMADGGPSNYGVIAGEVAGNLGSMAPFAHQPRWNEKTERYEQYTDGDVIAETVGGLAGMALPVSLASHGARKVKRSKTIAEGRAKFEGDTDAAILMVDGKAVNAINKKYNVDGKTDQSGFVKVESFDGMEDIPGAFVDKNGNVMVNTDYIGQAHGKYVVDNTGQAHIKLDNSRSNINDALFVDNYSGVSPVSFIDSNLIKDIPQGKSSKLYTSGKSIRTDESGRIVANEDLIKTFKNSEKYDSTKTEQENIDFLNSEIHKIQKGNKTSKLPKEMVDSIKEAIGKRDEIPTGRTMKFNSRVESSPSIEGQRILDGVQGSSNQLLNDIAVYTQDSGRTINLDTSIKQSLKTENKTLTKEEFDNNPFYSDIYNMQEIHDSQGNTIAYKFESVKPKVLKDLTTAMDLALASMKDVDGVISKKDIEGGNLARATANTFQKLHNLKPEEGANGVDLANINQELVKTAETIIRKHKDTIVEKVKKGYKEPGKQAQDGYVLLNNSRASNIRTTMEDFVMNDPYMTDIQQAYSELYKDLDHGTKEQPLVTKSGSSKTPTIKDKYSEKGGIVGDLANHQANLEFVITDYGKKIHTMFRGKLQEFLRKDNEDILKILNGGKEIRSENIRKQLIDEAKKLESVLREIDSLGGKLGRGKDGVIKFPAEVGENLRVLYTSDYSPMSNKVVRSIITPKVDSVPKRGNEMFIKRSILAMLDITLKKDFNGKNLKHKVSALTDSEVNTLYRELRDKGIKVDGEYIPIKDIVKDDTLMLELTADGEGFHALPTFKTALQMFDDKLNTVDLLVETDGINNGYMFQEMMAGNFDIKEVGLNVGKDGLATPDNIREQFVSHIKTIKDDLAEGPARVLAEDIKASDLKPGIMAKMYGGGQDVASDTMGSHMYSKYMDELGTNSKYETSVDQMINTFTEASDIAIEQIDTQINKIRSIEKTLEDTRKDAYTAKNKSKVLDEINTLEESLSDANRRLSELYSEHNINTYVYGLELSDLVSAKRKIQLDKDIHADRKKGHDIPDSRVEEAILTSEEIIALKTLFKQEAEQLVSNSIERLYAHPKTIKGMTEYSREWNNQLRRHNLAKLSDEANTRMKENYALIVNDRTAVHSSDFASTALEISKSIVKDSEKKLDITEVQNKILKHLNKKGESVSMVDVLDSVLQAGYSVTGLTKGWKRLRDVTPYVLTHHGEKAQLITFESRMGMVKTKDGTPMNYKSVVFRPNNVPIPILATDSGVMGTAIAGKNIMSILDAQFGARDVVDGMKKYNDNLVDIAKNYNLYKAINDAVSRSDGLREGAMTRDSLTVEDASHFLARTENRSMKQDHMKLVEKNRDALKANTDRSKLVTKLEKEAQNLDNLQTALSDDYRIQNISIGMSETAGTSKIAPIERFIDKDPEVKSNINSRNYTAYEEIPVIEDIRVESLVFGGKPRLTGKGSNNVKLKIADDINEFDGAMNTITLDNPRLTVDSYMKLNHEVGHKAWLTMSEQALAAVKQFIDDNIKTGKIEGVKTDPNTGNKTEVVVYMREEPVVDKSGKVIKPGKRIKDSNGDYRINYEETMSNMAEILLANEGLLSNATFFASKWGKVGKSFNIAELVEANYLVLNDAAGGNVKIHTMDQLVSHLKQVSKDKPELHNAFEEWKNNHDVAFNSSTDIKAYLNGYERSAWKSTLAVGSKQQRMWDIQFKNNMYDFVTKSLVKNGHLGSLFILDSKSEAMATIAALASGFDATHQKLISSVIKNLEDHFTKNMPKEDLSELNKSYGLHTTMGLHHFVNELKNASSFQEFRDSISRYDVSLNNTEPFVARIKKLLKQSGISASFKSEAELKSFVKKVVNPQIVELAKGSSGKNTNRNSIQLAKNILAEIDKKIGNPDRPLAQTKLLVDYFSKDIDKAVGAKRLRSPGDLVGNKYLKENLQKYYFNDSNYKQFSMEQLATWKTLEDQAKLEGNYYNQFNINPSLNYKKNGYTLGLQGSKSNYAGSIKVKDSTTGKHKEIPVYFIKSDEINIMKQDQVLMGTSVSDFEKGRTKIKMKLKYDKKAKASYIESNGERIYMDTDKTGSVNLHVKPERMMRSQLRGEYLQSSDSGFITMLARNRAASEAGKIKQQIRYDQMKIALDSGLAITAEQYAKSPNKENYHKLGSPKTEDGSLIKIKNQSIDISNKYGDIYYEKRFIADMEGTKGIKLHKKIDQYFGKNSGQFIKTFVKAAIGMRDFAKTTILVYSPMGWINSGLSSMSIYMVNADPGRMIKDKQQARAAILEYNKAAELYAKAITHAKDTKEGTRISKIKAAKDALEKTELYKAMSMGISSTIRSDAFVNSTYRTNPIVQMVNDFTGNKYAGEMLATVQADPTTKFGSWLGEKYDMLEVLPKMMLYFNKLAKYDDAQLAAQAATMANPQYGRNLPGFSNFINEIHPYMKYTMSWPSTLLYAGKTSPVKLGAMITGYQALLYGSWMVNNQDMSDNQRQAMGDGYARIPGTDHMVWLQAKMQYNNPIVSMPGAQWDEGFFNFIPEAPKHVAVPPNIHGLPEIPK